MNLEKKSIPVWEELDACDCSDDRLPFLYSFDPTEEAKAQVIVCHGLNVSPSAMGDMVKWLVDFPAKVWLTALRGHQPEVDHQWPDVSPEGWKRDLMETYDRVRKEPQGGPIWFVGYSLGALTQLSLLTAENSDYRPDKMILMAPAVAVKTKVKLLSWLKLIPGKFQLPSFSPSDYRFHSGTSLAAYRALLKLHESVQKATSKDVNLPTLVVMDSKDEVISLKKLKAFVNKRQLTQWQWLELESSEVVSRVPFHHLIISEEAMGPGNWQRFDKIGKAFLND